MSGVVLMTWAGCASDGSNQMPGRSQQPILPLPYAFEEVEFDNAEAGIQLAGTLTLPPGAGPHPAVVLETGSGPQDRDETVSGHKPFLVLADHLTRRGIAVLRYDDRGVGRSGGTFGTATMLDHASDARSAVAFLRSRGDIDIQRIGALGHSEGGMTVPRAALDAPGTVAFLVLLASPGLSGRAVSDLQDAAMDRARGVSDEEIERKRLRRSELFAILEREPDLDRAANEMRQVMRSMTLTPEEAAGIAASGTSIDQQINGQINLLNTAAQRFFLTYDPVPALELVDVPVLALGGERDLQVPPDENLTLIEAALDRGRSPTFLVRKLPRLNHLVVYI